MANLPLKIAIVYDRVNKWGGAERVLLHLNEIFPKADLFTAVYNSETARWASVFPNIKFSFLQNIPFAKKYHELFPWLTPIAFESLNLLEYDLVITVTSSDAKAVITRADTLHIVYCLTPTRYLWSHETHYKQNIYRFFNFIFSYLKKWDKIISNRPDTYFSISETVKGRIKKYYGKESVLIYPPVDTLKFNSKPVSYRERKYFLWVGRFVSYKNPINIAKAFKNLPHELIMVGTGNLLKEVKKHAPPNVSFTGQVNDIELKHLYSHAKGLIFFHEEDFGIVTVEAMSAGTPVITINKGGGGEVVEHMVSGVVSTDPTVRGLIEAIKQFENNKWNYKHIQQLAETYSSERFREIFGKVVLKEWIRFKNTYLF